jgi:hypothetical protein
MPKVQFLGRVLPQAISVSLPGHVVLWKDDANKTGLEATFRVQIAGSIVNVETETNRYSIADVSELYKQACEITRASVNLVMFAIGHELFVYIDTLIDPDGLPFVMVGRHDPALAKYCTAFSLSEADAFHKMRIMVTDNHVLSKAFDDLADILRSPQHVAPVNCARVIDGIRTLISPHLEKSAAWRAMQEALNIDKDFQQWISKQSEGPRHADPTYIPGSTCAEIARRTWEIMNRYLEYRKRGNQRLTGPDFPLLA